MAFAKDLTGNRYGRLVVIDRAPKAKLVRWNCKCDCGSAVDVAAGKLTSGQTKSCGCYLKDVIGSLNKTHAMTGSPEWRCYRHMMSRCYNKKVPDYGNYGGRGIEVCDRWRNDFATFFADMGKRPGADYSLDRVNVNGNYEPSNCRWANMTQQQNNRRNNRLLSFGGQVDTAANWARLMGMKPMILITRLHRGWDVEDAIMTPVLGVGKAKPKPNGATR